MNRVLVVFSDGLLSELDSARGLVSRSAWIRRAVENELGRDRVFKATYGTKAFDAMKSKEVAAPLVPEAPKRVWKGTAAEWAAFEEGAGFETPEETEILDRMHGITSEATVGEIADALEAEKAKPKARRKKMKELESETLKAMESVEKVISPQRCNRGACTGTIKPTGRCIRCNQEPLKESK